MPHCIHCNTPVNQLTLSYGKDPANIRLAQCTSCSNFADPYLEFDAILVFIDMLLLKPKVYRHIIFNRITYTQQGWNATLLKLGFLLVLFDIYLKWILLRASGKPSILPNYAIQQDHQEDMILSYLYLFTVCFLETLSAHIAAAHSLIFIYRNNDLIKLSMSIILSCFPKFMPMFTVIWDFPSISTDTKPLLINILVLCTHLQTIHVYTHSLPQTLRVILAMMAGRAAVQFAWKYLIDLDYPITII